MYATFAHSKKSKKAGRKNIQICFEMEGEVKKSI
jgi:hypothetical protein